MNYFGFAAAMVRFVAADEGVLHLHILPYMDIQVYNNMNLIDVY